jgi:hypothetical protein
MMNDLTTPLNAKLFIQEQAEVIYVLLTALEEKVPIEHKHLTEVLSQFYTIIKNQKAEIERLHDQIEQDNINAIEASEYD